MNVRRSGGIASPDTLSAHLLPVEERGVLNEGAFKRMISLERKRTERSRKPFLLMLVDIGNGLQSDKNGKALDKFSRHSLCRHERPTLRAGTRTTPLWESCSQNLGLAIATPS